MTKLNPVEQKPAEPWKPPYLVFSMSSGQPALVINRDQAGSLCVSMGDRCVKLNPDEEASVREYLRGDHQ